jgi:uncharacterized repeat protein (TIGR01451 family)
LEINMKLTKRLILPATISALSLMATGVHAAGTAAGTTVTNTATLDYQVNGVAQNQVQTEDNFNVDIKVDFNLDYTNTAANETSLENDEVVVATVTLSNSGNAATSFQLAADNVTGGDYTINGTTYTDNIDLTGAYTFYADNGDGVFDPATDTQIVGTTADIAADDTLVVFATIDKAGVQGVDGDIAGTQITAYGVTATYDLAGVTETLSLDRGDSDPTNGSTDDGAIANGADTIEVVFADAGLDNTESLVDILALVFPDLVGDPNNGNGNLTKTSVVISDPFNGTTNPKAIPGAVVEYTIAVRNTGSTDADNVVISDPLPADTTYNEGTLTFDGSALTDVAGDDAGEVTGSNVVVNVGTLANDGNFRTITFQATIN